MKRLILIVAALFAAALQVAAFPLQRTDVPENPVWVLHVDFDRLRPTQLGQWLLGEMEKPEAQAKLAAFQMMFSLDLRQHLHSATLYSTTSNPSDGVLLVYADIDAQRLTVLAQGAREHASTAHNSHTIHSWVDTGKTAKNGEPARTYAAIHKSRVIFGQRSAGVAAALDVLDRGTRTLANSSSLPELGASGSKSFIQAAARKMDMAANDPNAAVFRLSRQVRLDIEEAQQQVRAQLALEGDSPEVAHQISMIIQGVVALMKLQKEKPETAKFAESLSVAKDGASVMVSMNLSAPQVVEILKADAARKAAAAGK